jgi:hypothetical protein
VILLITFVETFKTDVIVFIDNVILRLTSHFPIQFSIKVNKSATVTRERDSRCDTSIIELFAFIGDMDTCPLISQCNTVSINELTLILNCIGKCDVKRNMTLSIKTITSVLNVSTNVINSITHQPFKNILFSLSNLKYVIDIIFSISRMVSSLCSYRISG